MNVKLPYRLNPWRITFDTNPDDCTLNCIMCEEFSQYSSLKKLHTQQGMPKKRRMPFELIQKVVNEIIHTGSLKELIPSTMGEPLLYKEFEKIIDLCQKTNLKLNLTTNSTFPRKNVIDWAELIIPVTSDVKISWNGATAETMEKIMKGIQFEKALGNVQQFIKVRDRVYSEGGDYCTVTFQMTFMESNYREIPAIIKLATELGVDRVKGHHLWTHFEEIADLTMRRNTTSIKQWNEVVKLAYKSVEDNTKNDRSKIKLDNIYLLDPHESNKPIMESWICPFLGQEAWVAWDGRFNPCCAPDEERKSLGDFGNLKETSFNEIWGSESYQQLIKNYKQYPLCKGCNMRRPKEGFRK